MGLWIEVTPNNLKETAMDGSKAVGLGFIPLRNRASTAAADEQLAIEFCIQNLLFPLRRREDLVLGDVGSCGLPMTGRREPGRMRGQNGWTVLIGRRCW
jgi:hypothetical protein